MQVKGKETMCSVVSSGCSLKCSWYWWIVYHHGL